jgi:outer membrane protein OmpU
MKKVIFATTALVATAGVAAADVTFGGYGRFGVQYVDPENGDSSTDVTSRLRLIITATAESDAGVTFGAMVRVQSGESAERRTIVPNDPLTEDNEGTRAQFNGVRFFARTGGLEVGVGNIFGVFESMDSSYPIDLGLTGLGYDYTPYVFGRADGYTSGDLGSAGQNGIEVLYSIGDFGLHLSASESGRDNDPENLFDGSTRTAFGVDYVFNGITLEAAIQDSDRDNDTEFQVAALGSFGAFDVSLAYAELGTDGGRTVLTGSYDIGAATNIEAYIVDQEEKGTFAGGTDTGYGIDFNHDLGGGTSLRGGVAKRIAGGTVADMGVRFNF